MRLLILAPVRDVSLLIKKIMSLNFLNETVKSQEAAEASCCNEDGRPSNFVGNSTINTGRPSRAAKNKQTAKKY